MVWVLLQQGDVVEWLAGNLLFLHFVTEHEIIIFYIEPNGVIVLTLARRTGYHEVRVRVSVRTLDTIT